MISIVYFPGLFALTKNNRVIYVFLLRNKDRVVLVDIETLHFYALYVCVVNDDQIDLKVQFHDLGDNELEMADI